MQGTYDRLRVHAFASWRDVVRAANGRIAKMHRRTPGDEGGAQAPLTRDARLPPKAPGSRPNLPALNLLSASPSTTHAARPAEHLRRGDAVRPKQDSARWRSTTPSPSISSATRRSRPASGSASQPSPPRANPTTLTAPSRLRHPPLPFRSRLPLRSRRSFAARISISTATAGSRRAGAIARERTLPRSGSQRQIEAEHRPATAEEQATPHPLHRLRRVRARQRRLPAPGRGRVPERLGGDRRRARARCRRQVLRLARALHAVRPLHAGIHRPSGLDGCDAARLPRRPGARTRHRQRPVSGVDAGSTARLLPRHRRRTRSGDRPDRETLAAACEDPQ